MVHHTQKSYNCNTCPRKFVTKGDLDKHVRWLHSLEYTFKCELCEFSTKSNTSLKDHIINRHTKDFPFKCSTCGSGFISRSKLDRHKKVYHGNKQIICQDCGAVFKNRDCFQKHCLSHIV